nr:hypothetical protein [uncultured Pedobacter sp.]
MKLLIVQFFVLLIANVSFSQEKNVAIAEMPYSTHLIDSIEKKEILSSLEGFLKLHFKGDANNKYIEPEYLKQNPQPFFWFSVDTKVNKPTLVSILPVVEHSQFLVTISYSGIDSNNLAEHVLSYSLIAKKLNGRYYFYNSVDYHTRNWNRKQVESILYIYPNKINLKEASRLNKFNKSFAKKLSTKIIPVTYYKCEDPVQLFRIMGCDYIDNMYLSTYGGVAEANHTIFAGNNSEWYPHEVVHFYTNNFKNYNRIVHEGYATYIGGSGGIPISDLRIIAKSFLENNPHADVTKMFVDFDRIDKGIPLTYIISGLICKKIEEEKGFSAIRELFDSNQSVDSYFEHLEKLTGIKMNDFPNYVKDLIK